MLIDGEKFACDACVRGHRVSNCQHADRALQHIAKKGRPVSQCNHCRTLRKSRAAHVKCDCGSTHHSKAACTLGKEVESKVTCCCSHGTRCTCSLKKEYLEAVPESESDEGSLPDAARVRRPRAHTGQSDGKGHYKPSHKHAHKKCGHPYAVPRAHPIQGTSNRSVDNLPLLNNAESLHGESQRMIKSEHGSPVMDQNPPNSQLPPLDIDNFSDFGFPPVLDYGLVDQPLFSAGLSATSIDWSHYDGLDFNNDSFAGPFSQAASYTTFEFGSLEQPALTTTSTSGEISEVEDAGLYMAQPVHYGSDYNSEPGENELFYGVQSQMMPPSLDLDELIQNAGPGAFLDTNHGLPMAFDENKYLALGFQAPFPEDDSWMNSYVPQQPHVAEQSHDHRVWDQ